MDSKRKADEPAAGGGSPAKILKEDRFGTTGMPVLLCANYFQLNKQPLFELTQYRVDFVPDIDVTNTRKKLIGENRREFGNRYIFDGASIYLTQNTPDKEIKTSFDGKPMAILIRRTGTVKSSDPSAFQLFNLIFREAMAELKLQNIRRDYFDPHAKIDVPAGNLELWPGYATSIRAHEADVLMCAEISHKFMRKETILDIAKKMMNAGADWQEKLKREVIGTVVLTEYTNKTYMVDDIDFTLNPRSTFKPENKEEETSYADYYKSRYGIDIKDKYQFLLVSKSTARDLRAGRPEMIYLIPELSRATGMTDSMRANFKLMQDLSIYTRLSPENRVKALCKFNKRIQDTPQSVNVLKEWNMELDKKLLEVEGRELPPETIVFGRSHEVPASIKGEWAIRNGVAMYQNVPIHRWLCIYPEKMETDTNKFLEILGQQCQEMQCDYKPPKMISLKDDRQDSYIQAVTAVKDKAPKLILFVLPTDRADRYSALKKACLVDYGIPCQVCIKRTMTNKNVVSIAAKVAIQMSVKLGATPWAIKLPVKGLMTVGFDVSHHPRDKSRSVGALVATMDTRKSGAFYSVTCSYKDGNEMNKGLAEHMTKAIEIYKETCDGSLPEKIMFYRDGVGDGQIQFIKKQEIQPLMAKLSAIYGGDEPKLAYIIVNKRTNTRMFKKSGSIFINPKPGTVVDRSITLPERNDFFLISQHVGQGTVTPTSYNVIHNTSGLSKDKLEILTYKFTHMYFNWSGTTRIPAVSQYAKKLAFLTSQSLQAPVHEKLERTLYFL